MLVEGSERAVAVIYSVGLGIRESSQLFGSSCLFWRKILEDADSVNAHEKLRI